MKVYYQESDNDCGISVTRSLINHFFKKEITRTELFNQVNISPDGLSIFELEAINRKYGIHLETYETTIEELLKFNTKNFFILVTYRDGREHFVISKKVLKNFVIYDSAIGKVKLNANQLNQIFAGKILLIEKVEDWKEDKNLKANSLKDKEIFILSFPKLFASISMELFTFIFLLISFGINKFIFEDVIQTSSWSNIGGIIFWAGLLILVWSLAEYLKETFYLKHKQWYCKKLYQLLFEKLENKKNFFFSKLSKNQFLMTHQYVKNLSLFYGEVISQLISSLFITLFLVFYLLSVGYWISLLVILMALVKLANFYWAQKLDGKRLPEVWKNDLSIQKLFFTLNHFLKNEWNYNKFLFLSKSLKDEITQHNLIEREISSSRIVISKLNFFITYCLNIAIYVVGCYFSLLGNGVSVANIILAGIIFHQLNGSLDKSISVGLNWNKYISSLKNYKQIIFSDNIQEENKLKISLPKFIELKNLNYHNGRKNIFTNLNLIIYPNTFLFGASGIGKSTLYKLISAKLNFPENSIFFDQVEISDISEKCFNKLVVYQNNQSKSEEFQWEKLYDCVNSQKLDSILQIAKKLDIPVGKSVKAQKFSDGQRQFINLLNLLSLTEKIILLDEVTSHINKEIKKELYELVFPILTSRNFLICCEHDLSLKQFFVNQVNLDQLLTEQCL
ncbi:cysteine peptidase family C39 domain-containing protein [Mycoplasma suis]|uniref:ABC transporter, ATP binding protein n=1 Tax=Mycoplasma suis (strain Illinois) TaxID=768700 RepID=F0QS97_MYCSL|nr:cysteine peptidase family C39 domain-containing protein [Mycoplasma suis]ADX98367.1 ABC transporter, ATP binding protein [Mycoplasma suis str. Illinois]